MVKPDLALEVPDFSQQLIDKHLTGLEQLGVLSPKER